jgi:hypothetical protein
MMKMFGLQHGLRELLEAPWWWRMKPVRLLDDLSSVGKLSSGLEIIEQNLISSNLVSTKLHAARSLFLAEEVFFVCFRNQQNDL